LTKQAQVVAGPEPIRAQFADGTLDVAAVQVAQRLAQTMQVVRFEVIIDQQILHTPNIPRALEK
jgi:hypothetical protein